MGNAGFMSSTLSNLAAMKRPFIVGCRAVATGAKGTCGGSEAVGRLRVEGLEGGFYG